MSFESDIARHQVRRNARMKAMMIGATQIITQSITDGSTVTGAPGQPVDTGALRGSWSPRWLGEYKWRISTKLVYAPIIEAGAFAQKSEVGGPHSVDMTRLAWQKIVNAALGDVL